MPDPRDTTLAARIFADLSRQILDGKLKPGIRLRQEEQAANFHASHVPVREAFRMLESEGLVEALPRRGVRVAGMDRDRHFEAVEMRAVLEGLALRHAAAHFPHGHLVALTDADHQCSAATAAEAWEAANRAFHDLLIAPCPMPQLLQSVQRLQIAARWGARVLGGARLPAFPREDRDHRAILQALRDQDAERGAGLLTRHIRRGHLAR